ncbi:MAG TPA: pyridoxamine 5'-phosphate oxidase family protein [Methanomassiliicoccales archaeon]|nr:pyridoxamine 5'-phosphate oxidase family protein [Methanomassiliicoccales archaeon]
MRKAEREIKDQKELEDLIRRVEVCRLAMVDDGEPYIVPMNFGYRDGYLFFHCAREGRKLDVLRKNPRVCFELEADVHLVKGEKACQWSTSYQSVIGWGTATISLDEKDVKEGLEVLMSHYTRGPLDFDPRSLSLTAVIKVKVERMTGKRSKR